VLKRFVRVDVLFAELVVVVEPLGVLVCVAFVTA
jgi:hypothetical protein